MLLDLKAYLENRGSASIVDLSNKFRTPPDALRGMLGHWIKKGLVVRHDFGAECGGCKPSGDCGGCGVSASFEIYDWIGPQG